MGKRTSRQRRRQKVSEHKNDHTADPPVIHPKNHQRYPHKQRKKTRDPKSDKENIVILQDLTLLIILL